MLTKRVFRISTGVRMYNSYQGIGDQMGNINQLSNRKTYINTVLNFVPQQEAWVVERFGKFHQVLNAGINILIPFVDRISYVHSLKEVACQLPPQSAITNDNVLLTLDGVLFYRVMDAYKASYGIENYSYSISQLAQTTMRSEIGKLSLDEVFKERDTLNKLIIESIRVAAANWGIECMRYEIRDVQPPNKIMEAMQLQVEAERKKRALILESEGKRDATINQALGEAEAIIKNASAKAQAIQRISASLQDNEGREAVSLIIAEKYIQAFGNLAKETNTMILPSNLDNIQGAIAQAMCLYKGLSNNNNKDKFKSENIQNGHRKLLPNDTAFDFMLEKSPTLDIEKDNVFRIK